MARPVESNSVTASAPLRPGAWPASTAPRSRTSPRATRPASTAPPRGRPPPRTGAGARTAAPRPTPRRDRPGQLAAVRRLRPLVAEQLAGDDRVDLRLGLARPVGAEHVEVQAGMQVRGTDD